MPITDKMPCEFFDLRTYSSDYTLTCPVHGQVYMTLQFNGQWNRTYCQDCFEDEVAKQSKKTVLNTNGGPPPVNRY